MAYGLCKLIGKNLQQAQDDIDLLDFNVFSKSDQLFISFPDLDDEDNSHVFSVEEITSMLFSKLKALAEDHLGDEVLHAVIAVPFEFNDI